MNLKQINFLVKIKDPKDNTRDFPIQRAYTNDLNSVRLTFEMIDTTAAELSGATASILFYMLDRSFFQDTATVTGNKVEYTLTEAQGNHAGMAQVQIMVTVGGVVYASAKRKFDIVSGLEMAVATEVMIKDWTMLTAEARAYLDEAEANEAIRIANETARVTAENQRNNDFSSKADKTYTDQQLALKADKADTYTKAQVDGKDALKADKTYTDTELAKKADKTYTDTELAKKAEQYDTGRELAKKADKTDTDTELAKKADKTYTDTELAKKADKTYTDTELAKKAEQYDTGRELAKKADKADTYTKAQVDGKDALKADKTYTDTELAKKADKTYTDTELAKKAEQYDTGRELAKKADKADTYTKAQVDGKDALKADKITVEAIDSEVILARGAEPTLGARLDASDAQLAEKANLFPMYFDDSLGEYVNVENYWNAQKTGKIYTTEFYQYSVSPSSLGVAKDDNVGLIAKPSTNTTAGRDDYVSIGLFRPVDVNGYVDENDDYHVTAIKGDGRFKADGSNGDVWVMNMTGYIKRYDTDTVWGYSYSDVMHGGFDVISGGRKINGTIRPYMLRAKYPAVRNPYDGNKLASISGQNPEYNNMSHNGQINAFKAKGTQYSGKTSHDDFWVKLMLMLKYKSTNTETLAKGCISYYSQYTPSVYESGVSRFIVTNAQAANFVVGSRVSVGDFSSGTQTADRQSALVSNIANRVKILGLEPLPDGLNTAINLDCSPFATNATTTISTMVWGSGACDGVLGVDGSPYDVNSGKEPLIINGIEIIHGGYEVIQNMIIYNDNADPLDFQIKAYICYDCKKYATSPTQDYNLISKRLVQTNNSWRYMSKGEIDINHPSVIVPTEANAGSTTGFADGIYTNSPTTGYRVWLSLGNLSDGALAGFFCLYGRLALTVSGWSVLGRLSATGRSWGETA